MESGKHLTNIGIRQGGSPDALYSKVSLGIAFLALCLIFTPSMLGLNMMRWGYGISFISFFLLLSALVVARIFHVQAKEWDRIQTTDDLLAHWKFEPEMWSRFLELDEQRERQAKKQLLWLIGVVMLFEGLAFILIFQDWGSKMVAVVLGVLWLVLALLAIFVPGIKRAKRMAAIPEVFISRSGLVFAGRLHSWSVNMNRLDRVVFAEIETPKFLEFIYSAPGRFTRLATSVRVPVPQGQENEARRIAEIFTAR